MPTELFERSRKGEHALLIQPVRGGAAAVADGQVKGAATNADYALERMVLGVLALRRH